MTFILLTLAAFLLIMINCHDLIAALQDNWTMYWTSLASRTTATAVFAFLGGGWATLWPMELGSAAILGACMAWSSRKASRK